MAGERLVELADGNGGGQAGEVLEDGRAGGGGALPPHVQALTYRAHHRQEVPLLAPRPSSPAAARCCSLGLHVAHLRQPVGRAVGVLLAACLQGCRWQGCWWQRWRWRWWRRRGRRLLEDAAALEVLELAVVLVLGVVGQGVGDELVGGDAQPCVVRDAQRRRLCDLLDDLARLLLWVPMICR